MCKFKQCILRSPYTSEFLRYIPEVKKCYETYCMFLQDDFSPKDLYLLIESVAPYFWLILNHEDEFMGFVFLDNFTGSGDINYSAELTTCFAKRAWGSYTRYSAKFFLKKCFDEFGFYKIKAQIYPDNFRIKKLLKSSGFVYEATLSNETQRNGQPQDIEVYSLYKSYYYKNEVNDE